MLPLFQVIDDWSGDASDAARPACLLTAGAARDAVSVRAHQAAVLIDQGQVVYAGPADAAPACGQGVQRLPLGDDALILPAMVNAHAHLELTAIGPVPYGGDFLDWVGEVIARRPKTAAEHTAAVAAGIRRTIAGGVIAVGDIGSFSAWPDAAETLAAAPLAGVAFDELLGLAPERWQPALALSRGWAQSPAAGHWQRSIEAHAPYTTAKPAMMAAAEACTQADQRLAIHAAELLEEDDFVRRASGCFRERFAAMGFWSPEAAPDYGHGLSPIAWLRPVLETATCLLAHGNYLSDEDIETLAETNSHLVYCPLASAYFHHPQDGHPPHRYRDLLRADVNVCLGTDSILCQPASLPREEELVRAIDDGSALNLLNGDAALSLLPALRFLYQRDGADPDQLLAMATVNGGDALGLTQALPSMATLQTGAPARFVVTRFNTDEDVDPWQQALR